MHILCKCYLLHTVTSTSGSQYQTRDKTQTNSEVLNPCSVHLTTVFLEFDLVLRQKARSIYSTDE
jgi:hypothetical protein